MKAIILAGGEGTRLRPLTCDKPKPMVRLCGRPVLEYSLELLARHGIREAVLTLGYLPQVILDHFSRGSFAGVQLSFVRETLPLGTAGGVRNALSPEDEEVLVLSGDALCDFDLTAAIDFHRRTGADGTLLVKAVADPREYGLVRCGREGEVLGFVEKPAYTQAFSDLANTGVYLLSRRALDCIPEGEPFDFARDLFPLMQKKKMRLMAWEASGYWCDVGDFSSYLQCQQDLLLGKVRCRLPGTADREGNRFLDGVPRVPCTIHPPVFLGRDVEILPGAVLERSVVDDGCHLGRCRVTDSVLLPHSFAGDGASVTGGLLCEGASLREGAAVYEGAVLGGGSLAGRDAVLLPGVKVWPGKVLEAGTIQRTSLKYGRTRGELFGEEGCCGAVGVELTPEFCASLGAAAAACTTGPVAVSSTEDRAAGALRDALCAGVQSAGRQVLDFGSGFLSLFHHQMDLHQAELGLFLRGGEEGSVLLLTEGGLPAGRALERRLEGALARGEVPRRSARGFGSRVFCGKSGTLYEKEARALAQGELGAFPVQLRCKSLPAGRTARRILQAAGCRFGRGLTLCLREDGCGLSVRHPIAGTLEEDRVLALCCGELLLRGEDAAVAFRAPLALDRMGKVWGRRVLRYYRCPAGDCDREARALARIQHWERDGILQAVLLLSLLARVGSLSQALCLIPPYAREKGSLRGRPEELLSLLSRQEGRLEEGLRLDREKGSVLVQPNRRGTALELLAEAPGPELAAALCEDVLEGLRTLRADGFIGRNSKFT